MSIDNQTIRKLLTIFHDLVMVVLAWELAWWVQFKHGFAMLDWGFIPVIVFVQAMIFWYFHLYRGLWRFTSLADLWNICRAALLGSLFIGISLIYFYRPDISSSILILYPVSLILLLGGVRIGYRFWVDQNFSLKSSAEKKRILIIGAGQAGEMLLRQIIRSGSHIPIALLDDNLSLKGAEIHGVKIYGPVNQLPKTIKRFTIDAIFIAVPSASRAQMKSIIDICQQTRLAIFTLPNLYSMYNEANALSKIHKVSIDDLLGRDTIELDRDSMQQGVQGKTILVTGGGGSIGSELCLQLAELGPTRLIIIEQNEFNLYQIEKDLTVTYPQLDTHYILGDLYDKKKVEHVVETLRPALIFHTAAYKHVPILEKEPREAVRNNILATKNIVDMAIQYQCEHFVLISTDKAVNPSSTLGITKRIAELYVKAMNHNSNTRLTTVRFGNVLGSTGSVIPLFETQIAQGGPVTVTHPEVRRFFMTIREACQLILQTTNMAKGGEVFVLDMGETIHIRYLAEQMIRLSGLVPGKDIEIRYTGLRPGEKMEEELFHTMEKQQTTNHKKIFLAQSSDDQINRSELIHKIEEMEKHCDDNNEQALSSLLTEVVSPRQSIEGSNMPPLSA